MFRKLTREKLEKFKEIEANLSCPLEEDFAFALGMSEGEFEEAIAEGGIFYSYRVGRVSPSTEKAKSEDAVEVER